MSRKQHTPQDDVHIYEQIRKAFAQEVGVVEYIHDFSPLKIDIVDCKGCPKRGKTSFSTIGASDITCKVPKHKKPICVELAGSCDNKFADTFFHILGSLAFCLIRSKKILTPGDCLRGYVSEYYKSEMEHVYFTAPFLWQDELSSFELPHKTVLWLIAVPISEAERKYLEKYGNTKFEELLQSHHADFYDLDRKSVM